MSDKRTPTSSVTSTTRGAADRYRPYVVRAAVVFLVILAGLGGMYGLRKLKKPPQQAQRSEIVVNAQGMVVYPEPVQVQLIGLGTVQSHQEVTLAAEVSGRVVGVHPELEEGNTIGAGEVLVQIDPRTYEASVAREEAAIALLEAEREQLQIERENLRERLGVVERIYELAQQDYERYRELVEDEQVEARSQLEAAEQRRATRQEQMLVIEDQLETIPKRLAQIEAQIQQAQARLAQARLDLERTTIEAPFTGRVDEKMVEVGQSVTPNAPLLTFVDDSELEIPIPLKGDEVARWMGLSFSPENPHWFDRAPERAAEIIWTENPEWRWQGRMDRVERYDPESRTITLVVVVNDPMPTTAQEPAGNPGGNPGSQGERFPLVAGMFCEVVVPGREIEGAFRVPRQAVLESEAVIRVEDERMWTTPVKVARYEEDIAYITEGLTAGQTILTRKPGLVVDGLRVNVTRVDAETATAAAAEAADRGAGGPVAPGQAGATATADESATESETVTPRIEVNEDAR